MPFSKKRKAYQGSHLPSTSVLAFLPFSSRPLFSLHTHSRGNPPPSFSSALVALPFFVPERRVRSAVNPVNRGCRLLTNNEMHNVMHVGSIAQAFRLQLPKFGITTTSPVFCSHLLDPHASETIADYLTIAPDSIRWGALSSSLLFSGTSRRCYSACVEPH